MESAQLRLCPRCSAVAFTGASDCPKCGRVFLPTDPVESPKVATAETNPPVLGAPLFPTYKQPPLWLAPAMFFAAVGLVLYGLAVAFALARVDCRGLGSTLCTSLASFTEAALGAGYGRVGVGALWIAMGVLTALFARHVQSLVSGRRKHPDQSS